MAERWENGRPILTGLDRELFDGWERLVCLSDEERFSDESWKEINRLFAGAFVNDSWICGVFAAGCVSTFLWSWAGMHNDFSQAHQALDNYWKHPHAFDDKREVFQFRAFEAFTYMVEGHYEAAAEITNMSVKEAITEKERKAVRYPFRERFMAYFDEVGTALDVPESLLLAIFKLETLMSNKEKISMPTNAKEAMEVLCRHLKRQDRPT